MIFQLILKKIKKKSLITCVKLAFPFPSFLCEYDDLILNRPLSTVKKIEKSNKKAEQDRIE